MYMFDCVVDLGYATYECCSF